MERSNLNYQDGIRVVCPEAFELHGKKVVFRIELDRKLVSHSGRFEIHRDLASGDFFIDIESQELIRPTDPPNTASYSIHLSQVHTDSISPANQNDLGIDFVVLVPFESRHYIPHNRDRERVSA